MVEQGLKLSNPKSEAGKDQPGPHSKFEASQGYPHSESLSLSLYIYTHTHTCVHVYMCTYIILKFKIIYNLICIKFKDYLNHLASRIGGKALRFQLDRTQ